MPKFEKQYVHFMWNDELKGKKVFCSDCVDNLKESVENNKDMDYVIGKGDLMCPFMVRRDTWMFVYYDPNYELKLAYEQGKTIQFRYKGSKKEWTDVSTPKWSDFIEYRIKPEEKPITNRELARWLAKGNGEWMRDSENFSRCSTDCTYSVKYADEVVEEDILIRKWEDTKWGKPTREYMGLE